MTLKPFDDTVMREMQNPEFAIAYLQDALDESGEEFIIALQKYARANAGATPHAALLVATAPADLTVRALPDLLRANGLHLRLEAMK